MLGCEILRAHIRARREWMIGAYDHHHLIFEELLECQFLISGDRAGDRKIELSIQQGFDGPVSCFGVYSNLDPRELRVKRLEHRRKPVIAGIALGADPQNAFAMKRDLANVLFGALQFLEYNGRRTEQSFTG